MRKSKRILASVLVIVMMLGTIPFSASAEMYPGVIGLSRRAAAEGIVMLQNDNDVLPLDSSRTVSVFGRVQYNYFYCGYGSGGDVKFPYSTNLLDGMRRNPGIKVNESLAKIYETWCKKNVPNDGSWGNWPTHYPEMPLTDDQVADASDVSDTAVVVIGRSAGEDRESTLTKGSYYLTDLEVEMLDKVTAAFDKIVVVLDVGNIIDMAWVDDYPEIDSILYAWQGGMESGPAVADILSGDESPSGKLAATIAYEYADYPSSENFGNREYTKYAEDIFVGYRYFETFAQDRVRYGFGYGLSYTDFNIETTNVAVEDGEIKIDVKVTNTGDYQGKEVVQVYYGAPQGKLGKAAKSMAAYAKTNLLQPGTSENIQISFKIDNMSSYDDAGKTGEKSAWVMEAGDYPIYVGNSVRSCVEVGKYTEPALRVTEQLSEAGAVYPVENAFARWTAKEEDGEIVLDKVSDMTPARTIDLKETILESLPEEYEINGENLGYKLIDVYEGNCTMEEYIKQMTVQDLADLTRGAGPMGHSFGIPGNASVYGGINTRLRDTFGIPAMSTTDGPSGIRMTASATLLPIGTTLACTWNDRLVEELYAGVGAEMVLNGSDALLAPGMNLQRDPLCGRNFEYFSEDPLLTGQMGANTVRGVQSQGVSATPKHFACNNQETNRNNNDSRLSERALREIYLKGFEICVKTAKPQNVMTSYNKINSVWGHYNYELNTVILREQWDYEGCVMTDWWMQSDTDPDFGLSDNAYRVRAQVDVLMPGENYTNGNPVTAYNEDKLTLGEIQRSAVNVLNFALKSAKFRKNYDLPLYEYKPGEPVFEVVQAVQGTPELSAIYLDGEPLQGFSPLTTDYLFYRKDMTSFPTVTAEADAGVKIDIIPATAEIPCATVYARTEDGGQAIYRINWTNQAGLTPIVPNPTYAYLTNIYVNGEALLNFYQGLYSYSVWVDDPEDVEITADVPSGVDYSVTRDGDIFTIRAESEHQAMEYQVALDYFVPVPDDKLPKSDEFDGTQLQDIWTVDNPTDMFSKPDGLVRIITEGGDWYQTATDQKNTVWQYAYGDWTSVTKLTYDIKPDRDYQQMGVVIFDDDNNWVQWRMEHNSWGAGLQVSMNTQVNGANTSVGTTTTGLNELPATDGTFYLKVEKKSNTYTVSYSPDGENWYAPARNSATVSLQEPKFGIFAISGNTSNDNNPRITVDFDYVNFEDVRQPEPMPPLPVPVVDITTAGTSKVKLAADKFYMTSGLGTENTSDSDGGQNVGWTSAGQFLLCNINVEKSGYYNLTSRYAAAASPTSLEQISYSVHVDGERAATFNVRGTGNWQNWSTTEPALVYLEEGMHKLMFYCDTGSFNINWLQFEKVLNKEPLNELYNSALGKDSEKYTEESWELFEEALEEAKAVMDNESTDPEYQDVVDTAFGKLQAAIDGLTQKKEATPEVSIDYINEELTGFTAGIYTINGETVNIFADPYLILEEWMGTTLIIVKKGNGTALDSDPQELSIPARPAAPNVSAVNETYEGRNDGKITGVATNMEYRIITDSTWTACTGTEITGLAPGEYLVRNKAVAESSFAGVAAVVTINSGPALNKNALNELYNSALDKDSSKYTEESWAPFASALEETKSVLDDDSTTQGAIDAAFAKLQAAINGLVEKSPELEKEATPNASIDYVAEKLTGLTAGTYTINGDTITVFDTTCYIAENWMGTTLNIVKKGNGTTTVDSDPQVLVVPARPAAPQIYGYNETYGGRHDGKITGVSTDMEYSGSTGTWIACTGTEITGLASGAYLVRYKAVVGSSFASETAMLIIRSDSNVKNFKDVKASDWFYDAVQYVNSKGLMIGTTDDTFEPEFKLNRATVVMVLYRMDGEPDVTYSSVFKDVPKDKWYSKAVAWGAEHNIVVGYGDKTFGPEDNITREQFAAMMHRFAEYKDYDLSVPSSFDLSKYTDANKISDWAKDDMLWCVYNELITGTTDTTLEPTSTATRAQCAAILQRYTENIVAVSRDLCIL